MSATLAPAVPLSQYTEYMQVIEVVCEDIKNNVRVNVPRIFGNSLQELRALLIYLWTKKTINVLAAIKSIYANDVLYFSLSDPQQRELYEDVLDRMVMGKIKYDKFTGEEIVKKPKEKKVKFVKSPKKQRLL